MDKIVNLILLMTFSTLSQYIFSQVKSSQNTIVSVSDES